MRPGNEEEILPDAYGANLKARLGYDVLRVKSR